MEITHELINETVQKLKEKDGNSWDSKNYILVINRETYDRLETDGLDVRKACKVSIIPKDEFYLISQEVMLELMQWLPIPWFDIERFREFLERGNGVNQ